jgi:hypothetical protein
LFALVVVLARIDIFFIWICIHQSSFIGRTPMEKASQLGGLLLNTLYEVGAPKS